MKWKEFVALHASIDPEEEVACILWTRPDVYEKALEEYPDVVMTDEIADEVLCRMDHNVDCEIGMTWDTLEYYLKEVLRTRKMI